MSSTRYFLVKATLHSSDITCKMCIKHVIKQLLTSSFFFQQLSIVRSFIYKETKETVDLKNSLSAGRSWWGHRHFQPIRALTAGQCVCQPTHGKRQSWADAADFTASGGHSRRVGPADNHHGNHDAAYGRHSTVHTADGKTRGGQWAKKYHTKVFFLFMYQYEVKFECTV